MPISLNWPDTGLDSLPKPGESAKTNDPGFYLDEVITAFATLIERMEARWGEDAGSTTPDAIHKTPKATGSGASAWGYHGAVLLGEATGTGSSGVIEFSSINQNFGSLLLVGEARGDAAGVLVGGSMTLETVPTAGAYFAQQITAAAAAVSTSETLAGSAFGGLAMPAASAPAGLFVGVEMLFPNYTSTRHKQIRISNAAHSGTTTGLLSARFGWGWWASSAPITLIRLLTASGNFAVGTTYRLYGLPGA